jgi:lysophospholipase L1-like esterase
MPLWDSANPSAAAVRQLERAPWPAFRDEFHGFGRILLASRVGPRKNQLMISPLFFPIRCLTLLLLCVGAFGQADQPATAARRLQQWRRSRAPALMNDFGELQRYREANSRLGPARPDETRVVFFGDSITDAWHLKEYFPGKPYINRGISGQTTPQMLIRFRQDVIDLQPKVVIILAGTNDVAGNTGPMSLEQIEANYASLAELARAHNIRVVFCSVLPLHNYTLESQYTFPLRSPQKILQLNQWLKNYCPVNGLVYVDYFTAMVDDKGLLRKDLAEDGLHPNPAGYRLMAPLAAVGIQKALALPERP